MSSISFSTAFSLCKLLPGNTFHVTFSIIAFLLTIVSLLECSVAQLCLTLCNSMDCSPPGSSVHEILQARILEWVAMPLLQGIFQTQGLNPYLLYLRHWQAGSLPLVPHGKPDTTVRSTYIIHV